jgi:hypothetical protein
MMRCHNEGAAEPAGFPYTPLPASAREKAFAQHDDHAVKYGKRIQDFANIVQEGCSQQVRVVLAGKFQPLESLKGMHLLGRLHPAKKDDLGR